MIAEKAIVCYRCGTPTAVPAAPERKTAPPGPPWVLLAGLVLVAFVAAGFAWTAEAGGARIGLWVASALALVAAGGLLLRRPG